MPRQKHSEQQINRDEESESSIKTSVREGSTRLERNVVHGIHYSFAFWRWRNKFQETDGVASGEEQQQNRGDAVEPCRLYLWSLSPLFREVFRAVNEHNSMHSRYGRKLELSRISRLGTTSS